MADDVLYKFYWNGVSSDKLISANTVDIPAKSTVDVEEVKSGLTLGEHKIGLHSIMQIPVSNYFTKRLLLDWQISKQPRCQ